ncbi:MAG: preprotein translocase subunit SecE [Pseudomonadota bacterium]
MKKNQQKRKKKGAGKKPDPTPKSPVVLKSENKAVRGERENKQKAIQPKPVSRKETEKSSIVSYIKIATQFLRESRMELKKVKWPTRKELLAATAVVIFLVMVVSLFLGLIDFGLIKMIKGIIG